MEHIFVAPFYFEQNEKANKVLVGAGILTDQLRGSIGKTDEKHI